MAYERETEIKPDDIFNAVQSLRRGCALVKQKRDVVGFEPARNLNLEPGNLCAG
jgi:hypothetical protein